MARKSRLFLFAIALVAVACGQGATVCPQMVAPALIVTVVDRSGTTVCDAEVGVREGTFAVRLETYPSSAVADCVYFGPPERAGTYTVQATLGDRTASLSDVMVERNDCGVRTQRVILVLP